jgi:hypothetical protein
MAVKSLKRSSVKSTQKTNSVTAGYRFQDFELIESAFLASNTANVTFSNLQNYATEYKHLQIRYTARSSRAGDGDNLGVRFNGVTTSSYSHHRLFSNVGAVAAFGSANANTMLGDGVPSATSVANCFGGGIIDILDPYSTTKNKTMRVLCGYAQSSGVVELLSGAFYNLNALSSVEIVALTGSLVSGSRFSLYGIR